MRSEAPHLQDGASGKCRYDYRVGFPPRPCSRKAGHPAGRQVPRKPLLGADQGAQYNKESTFPGSDELHLPVSWRVLMQHWARIAISKSDLVISLRLIPFTLRVLISLSLDTLILVPGTKSHKSIR